jgi:hypothetical protein
MSVADAEGFNVHRRQHRSLRQGEEVEVRRSPQAMACRKRSVRNLRGLMGSGKSDTVDGY